MPPVARVGDMHTWPMAPACPARRRTDPAACGGAADLGREGPHHVVGGGPVEEFQENHAQVLTAEYWLQAE